MISRRAGLENTLGEEVTAKHHHQYSLSKHHPTTKKHLK
jgi:hypothetical protein